MGLLDRLTSAFTGSAGPAPEKLPGRNEECWCGSGRKYKKCHLARDEQKAAGTACSQACGPT